MTGPPDQPDPPRTRLHCPGQLTAGAAVALDAGQAHRLRAVLRLSPGDPLRLFNARDGEWRATLEGLDKKAGLARIADRLRAPEAPGQGPWLVFAPVKKDALDTLVEKAVELGAGRLLPVLTAHTDVARVRTERLTAQAVAAAEQCERLDVPDLAEPARLSNLLGDWPRDRALVVCAEVGNARPLAEIANDLAGRPVALMTGPEGGFARDELDAMRELPFVHMAGLGPRVLRAETAALAALAGWQFMAGDAAGRPPHR